MDTGNNACANNYITVLVTTPSLLPAQGQWSRDYGMHFHEYSPRKPPAACLGGVVAPTLECHLDSPDTKVLK